MMTYLVIALAMLWSFIMGAGLMTYYFLWLDRQSGMTGGGSRQNRWVGMPHAGKSK